MLDPISLHEALAGLAYLWNVTMAGPYGTVLGVILLVFTGLALMGSVHDMTTNHRIARSTRIGAAIATGLLMTIFTALLGVVLERVL